MVKKKLFIAVGLLVMLLTLTGCQSGVNGDDELAQSVNDSEKAEVFIKAYGQMKIDEPDYHIYEVYDKELVNTTHLDLAFYIDGKRIIPETVFTDEEIEKFEKGNNTLTLTQKKGVFKFNVKPGTYSLEIRDRNGNLENNYKGEIIVRENTNVVELDLGIYKAIVIDAGEIELDKK